MRTIDTQRDLIPWLLKELARSTPQMALPSGFLIALAGVCAGLSWEPSDDAPLDLVPVIAPTNFHIAERGVKLVDLARTLAEAEALEPSGAWSKARLIRLMVKCLDVRWLQIHKGVKGKHPYLRATPGSPYSHKLKVRVSLHTLKTNSEFLGGPTDKRKVQVNLLNAQVDDLNKQVRALKKRIARVVEEKEEAASSAQTAQQSVLKAQQVIRRQENQLATLQTQLARAQETIRGQEKKLLDKGVDDPIYRRVGLHEKCPDFVLSVVRRAYRANLHPDTHRPHEKAAAEQRFKEAEAVFATIFAKRGLS